MPSSRSTLTFVLLGAAVALHATRSRADTNAPKSKPSVDDEPAHVAQTAEAPRAPSDRPAAHTGFMVRVALGYGTGSMESSCGPAQMGSSGGTLLASLALGAAVVPNLALGVEAFTTRMMFPTVVGSTSAGLNDFAGGAFGSSGVGANLTYYLMPVDVFLSATVGVARVDVGGLYRSNGTALDGYFMGMSGAYDKPFAFALSAGKQWSVSPTWGLGIAGQFIDVTKTKPYAGNDASFSLRTFGLSLVGTCF